eukprot:CAMPEP_0185749416 /NCGR_PEP_ID=MMETSP1174-20130828/8112_1 /TAXON_ID=35687 /ORGANISM="Dictyocha speculum, Strain CCMP1381" /LENGTH=59 /DNA_ID=CAMNT_0028425511 /DNA_START=124 /DNA_END=300 /DNA_ORIENTATION=+
MTISCRTAVCSLGTQSGWSLVTKIVVIPEDGRSTARQRRIQDAKGVGKGIGIVRAWQSW